MIGIHDHESAIAKAVEIIKLADAWFEKKQIPLYFSVVMMTDFVGMYLCAFDRSTYLSNQ